VKEATGAGGRHRDEQSGIDPTFHQPVFGAQFYDNRFRSRSLWQLRAPRHAAGQFDHCELVAPVVLRGRGHFFGEATGRIFSGVLTPFFLEPFTGSPTVFFGTIMVVVAVGACVPLLFGKETVGQLELVTEAPAAEPVR